MKVVVFGATGPLGRLVVGQALQAGHDVTAAVRSPDAFGDTEATVVEADVLELGGVCSAVSGQDAVVSTIDGGLQAPGRRTLNEDAARKIVAAMHLEQARRLVVVSSWGVGDSNRRAPIQVGTKNFRRVHRGRAG